MEPHYLITLTKRDSLHLPDSIPMKDEVVFATTTRQAQWFVHPQLINMNLALIDPFQLAQDYPDALTNDLREYQLWLSRRNMR